MYESVRHITPVIYRKVVKEFKEKFSELSNPNVIYVVDLVSCSNKWFMRLTYPELTLRFEPILLIGRIIHEGLTKFLEEEGYVREYEVSARFTVDSKEYLVKGRVDAYNPDEGVVVEIKSTRRFHGSPLEHHVMQLRIYMELLDADRGVIVYLSPHAIVEYAVERSECYVEKYVEETVKNTTHPRWTWECDVCLFNKLCGYYRRSGEVKL